MTIRLAGACLAVAAAVLAAGAGAASAAAPHAGTMLQRLNAVENDAEAIAEGEVTGARARAAAARAASAWRAIRPGIAASRADASVPIIDAAVAALGADRDPGQLRRDANEVTGAIAPLFTLAGEGIPVEIHLLDYLGRSIALDARAADWPRATADAAALSRNWSALRPLVVQRARGPAAAAAYDRVTRAIAESVGGRRTAPVLAAATRSAAQVDVLESLFGG
ncbi:MAG TPA: hypothetical protein VK669_11460 [Candidatus Limnocylindrales bacterium]|nr:hypothetical protein [Candidatus Limnocylindrales bacterium]